MVENSIVLTNDPSSSWYPSAIRTRIVPDLARVASLFQIDGYTSLEAIPRIISIFGTKTA